MTEGMEVQTTEDRLRIFSVDPALHPGQPAWPSSDPRCLCYVRPEQRFVELYNTEFSPKSLYLKMYAKFSLISAQ